MCQLNFEKAFRTILLFVFILLVTPSNALSAIIKGKVLDKTNKPFNNVSILTVINDADGDQIVMKHKVNKKGNYVIDVNFTGYMQIVVGIDSVDKLLIPMFIERKKNYELNMKLPHTKYPYISFDKVDFTSKNAEFLSNIKILNEVMNSADLLTVYYNGCVLRNDTTGYEKNITGELSRIAQYYRTVKDMGYKYVIGLNYINSFHVIKPISTNFHLIDNEIVQDYLKNFNYSTSYLHSFPINFDNFADILPNGYFNQYLTDISTKSTSKFLKYEVLGQATAYYFDIKNDKETSKKFYYRLQNEYPNTKVAFLAKLKYDPNKKIQVDNILPLFSIQSQDDENVNFDNEYFEGKYLLIHFWTTESKESIDEINNLTSAMSMFYDDNFEILSISFDKDWKDVVKYRLNGAAMKWNHSWESKGFESAIANDFELYKIPYYILVSPTGKILAIDDILRGKNLINILNKYLSK